MTQGRHVIAYIRLRVPAPESVVDTHAEMIRQKKLADRTLTGAGTRPAPRTAGELTWESIQAADSGGGFRLRV